MKRIIPILVIAISLCACGGKTDNRDNSSNVVDSRTSEDSIFSHDVYPDDMQTTYTYTTIDGNVFPIWITPQGRCYIIRTTKDGIQCRHYLNEPITKQICAELNIEHKKLIYETNNVQELVKRYVIRDSTYYDLLDIDFDGIEEWLSYYITGAYVLVTYDVYELCGDSLVMKKAANEVHDHFFIDQNTRFDTINKRIINHFHSGCLEYVDYVYQADEKGNLTLIYDERVYWDYDKMEAVSDTTYYQ